MPPLVSIRKEERVLVIGLARPRKGNSLSRSVQQELAEAWLQLENDDDLLVGVLHGEGGVFSTGHDVPELSDNSAGEADPSPEEGLFPHVLSKPVIAAVEGACFGLGFELALACDLRIAGGGAQFGFPDTDLHVSYRLASALLPRITTLGASLDLLLTGNIMDGKRLEQLRLVNRTSPTGQALNDALALASDMARRFGTAGAFRKEQIWQFAGLPLPSALTLARMPYGNG